MIKAVLDTNVLVSAFIIEQGKPAQIVSRAYVQDFSLLLSEAILQETQTALHYKHIQKRFHPTEQAIEKFLFRLRTSSTLLSVRNIENIVPHDPPDNLVLACAVEGGADYLVSGNLHLLDLKQHRGVKIVTPAQFLNILNQSQIANPKSEIENESQQP